MKARILVIEDEMSINDLLCMNLEIEIGRASCRERV